MQPATRIEPRVARQTNRLAIQVLKDGQLSAVCAAQNRLLSEFNLGQSPGRMTGFQFVTVVAGIIRDVMIDKKPETGRAYTAYPSVIIQL
jgi:hypothetical protein